jgi:methionyl-tRNA synthetase
MNSSARVIITSAPPNPNGDLHLGHLSGPFLGADVLRRYLRQIGQDVSYVGYSDGYSCYVPRRATELGRGAHETAHVFGRRMEETLGLAEMQHDYFTHPLREPLHSQLVQRFFLELWDKGAFDVAPFPVYWCTECERYLYEAEMRGRCQFCAEPSDGFYCEQCGRPQESSGLTEPQCTRCLQAPQLRTIERIFFPLERYREALREYYADRPMRPALRGYLDDMFSRPLPVTPISRIADYGIPVPLDGWQGNILDTWYSGIFGYVAATVAHGRALGRDDEGLDAWQDPETRVFEFIGFDCSFSHAILWAALALAHGGLVLPEQVVTNEFYRLEGDKFSTSRGHAIWGNEFLRRVPADQLRFYLCLSGPEREQTNFFGKDFQETSRQLLVDGLQGWATEVVGLVARDFAGVLPPTPPRADGPLALMLDMLPDRLSAALEPEEFSPHVAAATVQAAIECAVAQRAQLTERRAQGGDQYAAELVLQVQALARIAAGAAPLMPGFAEVVWTTLGLEFADPFHKVPPWPAGTNQLVPAGQEIQPVLPELFRSITS